MKKKLCFLVMIMILSCFIAYPVMAADIKGCSVLGNISIDEKIPDTIHTVYLVIQIAVPVILVIFGMIDLMKAVIAQKEDEIKKGQQTFIKRLLAAAIVFFVFVIVKLLIGFVAGDDSDGIIGCANCFISGSDSESCK